MENEWNICNEKGTPSNIKVEENTKELAKEKPKKKHNDEGVSVSVDEVDISQQATPVSEAVKDDQTINGQEQLIKEYQEQIRRTQADFENYKKRTEERMSIFIEEANSQLICSLLPVLDNLDRAVLAIEEHNDVKSLQEGITMIHRQFKEVLERAGINRIPTKDEIFEPERYEAVLYEESEDVPPLHILEEMRPGYMFKSKVLRPAMVKVAKEPNTIK